ncbi:MAG: Ig-like domain-containing protein [Burkholderiales bacterium]|nr:Ig-like domain-containing protein [Burkholderiales bacterium]
MMGTRMMQGLRAWGMALAVSVALAACGGGGGNPGECGLGCDGGGATVSELRVAATSTNTSFDLSAPAAITVTVTAVDATNKVVADAAVTLSADNGGKVTAASTTTNASGQVSATIEVSGTTTVGAMKVTATSGGVTGSTNLTVADSQVAVGDLVLALSSSAIDNSGGDEVTLTVTAVDAKRNTVPEAPVTITVDDSAAIIAPSGTVTDAEGKLTAKVTIGSDKTNRAFTLSASSGAITKTTALQVTGANLSATYASAVSPGSSGNTIRYLLADANALPMAGQSISISAPGLTSVVGTTDTAGAYTYTYTAPTSNTSLVVTATAGGTKTESTIQVQTSGTVPPATGTVSAKRVSMEPRKVAVNEAGQQTNQAQVRVLFLDADNKGIANMRVRLDLAGDANNVGGKFANGTSMLYTSSDGSVTTSYIPGTRSSPIDGLTIRACFDKQDFAEGTCPDSVTTTGTVTSSPLSISLGTNQEIEVGETKLTYIKRYGVLVSDSSGAPMPGVSISATLELTDYGKGYWGETGGGWVQTPVNAAGEPAVACANEDLDRYGDLDTGEDTNNSGALEPRAADALASVVSGTTDTSGRAVVMVEYQQEAASWVKVLLKVTATGVSGTEGTVAKAFWLWVPADVVNDTSASPPFVRSPYGLANVCSNKN